MRLNLALMLMVATALAGCGKAKVVRYTPNGPAQTVPDRNLRLAVASFEDLSPDNTTPNPQESSIGCVFYVPVITKKIQMSNGIRPTNSGAWNCSGPIAVDRWREICKHAEARVEDWLAEDLAASGMFETVERKPWSELAANDGAGYDVILTGRFLGDERKGRTLCIMNPLMLVFQMMIPVVPNEWATRTVTLEVEARDPKDPAVPLWTRAIELTDPKSGSFHGFSSSEETFRQSSPALYRKAFAEIREGLATALARGGALESVGKGK